MASRCGTSTTALGTDGAGRSIGMRGRKLAQQLFGIEADFDRDRANDRAAVDAFGSADTRPLSSASIARTDSFVDSAT